MVFYTRFRTPREVCYAIQKVIGAEFDKLTARPWNMYDPDATSWWLVPSNDWPAYKHGKFYFDWAENGKNSILLGLYIEKGLGPIVAKAYSCPKGLRLIMHRDWTWFGLIRDLENGLLPHKVKEVAITFPTSFELVIDGGYIQNPCDFDLYGLRPQWSKYFYEWDTSSGQFVLKTQESTLESLRILTKLKTFDDLSSILQDFASEPWLWVDFFIGIRFQILSNAVPEESIQVWDAFDFWDKFLRHFTHWMV